MKLLKFQFNFILEKNKINFFHLNNFFKILKFLWCIKRLKVFINEYFFINDNTYVSFWIPGFISNYKCLKWLYLSHSFVKSLPYILINLTFNKEIFKEIKDKNLPLINLHFNNGNDYYDYFFHKNIDYNIDNIYFYILLINKIKNYKNV